MRSGATAGAPQLSQQQGVYLATGNLLYNRRKFLRCPLSVSLVRILCPPGRQVAATEVREEESTGQRAGNALAHAIRTANTN